MLAWLKGLFSSPKTFAKLAVDSLDLGVPYIAAEFDKAKTKYGQMTSTKQAQTAVDAVQSYLRKQWTLEESK